MLLGEKSSKVTPSSLPVMVIVVPPSMGPDFGLKSVITGGGQFNPLEMKSLEQSSMKLQLSAEEFDPRHHPH